jgi:DNA repair protein SbcC/Rad50
MIERDLRPWIQLRLAHRLLVEAQRRFQERAQGPMLERASEHFRMMTDNVFSRLYTGTNASERQLLLAQRADASAIGTDAMSEGTRDQLYLALRLAAVSLRRDAGVDLPMVLDDVLMTSSDGRAGCVLQALAEFSRGSQVIVFTHHEHLLDVARRQVPAELLHVTTL